MTEAILDPLELDDLSGSTSHALKRQVEERYLVAGKEVSADLTNNVVDGFVERTIQGASALDIVTNDYSRDILRSDLAKDKELVIELDGKNDDHVDRRFAILNSEKESDSFTFHLEDLEIHWLRRYNTARKVERGKYTRAEFFGLLLEEVTEGKIDYFCPELHVDQRIEKAASKNKKTKSQAKTGGIPTSAKLTVKGSRASAHQIKLANACLDEAHALNAEFKVLVAMMETIIVENSISNSGVVNDGTSVGLFQASAENGSVKDRLDIKWQVDHFIQDPGFTSKGGAATQSKRHPDWSAGQIAQAVQGSAYPHRYDQYRAEAIKWVKAYGAGGGDTSRQKFKKFEFKRNAGEDTWTCIQRLASDVNWRAFMVDGTLYFVSETDLIQAEAIAVIDEDTPGVDNIDFAVDPRASRYLANEATITCRADQWDAPPGSVIELTEQMGIAKGKWLVSTIHRPLYSADCEITIKQPENPKPEPAPESVTVSGKGGPIDVKHLSGTPKEIIDQYVLPIGRKHGLRAANGGALTADNVVKSNAAHSQNTASGNKSDHKGPPDQAWAVDMGNGWLTPQEDACAKELAQLFDFKSHKGLLTIHVPGYQIQLIFGGNFPGAGEHRNHVHCGIHRA